MRQLIIKPKFRDKIPPLSVEEFSRLEENILADGEVLEPLVVWHNTIMDGHNRWAIIQKHLEILYKVSEWIPPISGRPLLGCAGISLGEEI